MAVLVPCFNEAETIGACVEGLLLLEEIHCVAVVDDGSSDSSLQHCMDLAHTHGRRLKLFALPGNRGKNGAIRYAAERLETEVLIIFDADLTVNTADVGGVLELVKRNPGCFVYGTRFRTPMSPGAMPLWNRLGNLAFAAWLSRLVGLPISDAFCGLKALPRDVLLDRRMSRCRWGDLDLIFAAAEAGLEFREVPVAYRRRQAGVSKMNALRAGPAFAIQCLCYGLRKASYRVSLSNTLINKVTK